MKTDKDLQSTDSEKIKEPMHQHKCRYCEEDFVCGNAADDCFAGWITCRDCFDQYELKWLCVIGVLLMIAIGLTVWLCR